MMRRTVAVALLCLAALTAGASEIPDKPERFLVDKFHVLTPAERKDLEEKLVGFSGTSQIYVYIGRSVPSDTTLEQFATATFNYWGVGDKVKNNGVLLMLFLRSRQMRIETGDGIRPVLTDQKAAEILDSMKPYLRAEDYAQAVDRGVGAIMRVAASPRAQPAAPLHTTTAAAAQTEVSPNDALAGCGFMLMGLLIMIGFAALVIWFIVRVVRAAGQASASRGTTFGGTTYGTRLGGTSYGTRTGGSVRVDHYHHDDSPSPSFWSSSGSSGSSSSSSSHSSSSSSSSGSSSSGGSGGGGHSSGGGASGSW
jgi:uncharacterized protein